jgi:tripartite-type tricarboxylate transporter receptor subunit TctC
MKRIRLEHVRQARSHLGAILKGGCITLAAIGVLSPASAHAADFYSGKTINIMVSYAAGGGYDLYSRMLARYFGDHIPGNPHIVVQNMPGGGGVRAANYVYAVAPKDGTSIAAVSQNIPLFQLLGGEGVQYDVAKFNWIGVMAASNSLVLTWKGTGIDTIEAAKTREVSMAANGIADDGWIYPKALNALLGTKFKVINGYNGTADGNNAVERGEVDGMSRASYTSFKAQKQDWIQGNKITIIAQIGFEKEPDLRNVPLLLDLVQTEEQRQIATVVSLPTAVGYGHWLAPEVPADRIKVLRDAYAATVKDPALLAEGQKHNLDIRAKDAEEIERRIKDATATPKAVLEKTATILEWN